MVPTMKMCKIVHNVGSKCRGRVQRCPIYIAEFSDNRNFMLDNIARKQSYPCPNKEGGCRNRLSIVDVKELLLVCIHGIIKCPFHKLNACYWTRIKNDTQEHAVSAHERSFLKVPSTYLTTYLNL